MIHKTNKNVKGITLIALVVTIIVLLILSGVAISLTVGNNGMFQRAQDAAKEYSKAEVKEELEMLIGDLQVDLLFSGRGYISEETEKALNKKGAIVTSKTDEILIGEYKDYEFTVDKNGNITMGDKLTGEKPEGTAELLTTEEGILEAQILVTGSHEEGIAEIRALNGAELVENNGEDGIIYKVVENGTYNFLISANNGRNLIVNCSVENIMKEERDIFTAIEKTTTSTKKKIKVVGSENTEVYGLNIIQITGNVELGASLLVNGTEQEIEGITKSGTEYSVGSVDDVAKGTGDAQNTAVLKVDGNLTINENTTLTAEKSMAGLGGPKGLIIYCTGELINNGTISMTARGAKAEGQNVYLYKNKDNSFEYIPKAGGAGGGAVSEGGNNNSYGASNGKSGSNGSNRGTGGGGSGGAGGKFNTTSVSGAGSVGTSYSGGIGGGGAAAYYGGSKASEGAANGGAGGKGGTATSGQSGGWCWKSWWYWKC